MIRNMFGYPLIMLFGCLEWILCGNFVGERSWFVAEKVQYRRPRLARGGAVTPQIIRLLNNYDF